MAMPLCAQDATPTPVASPTPRPVPRPSPTPIAAQPEALQNWRDARFGMFIHWGPVSLKGSEISWSRGSKNLSVEEYDSLYKQFNPVKFDANAWVTTAKAAGMKYIVLTTKHHDGFCLWDTKETDYNIMNTPFHRDVVAELSAACKKQGIPFGAYYSTCDWHHPDFPVTSPGGKTRRETSNIDRYTQYLEAQITELLKNYGPLWTLWFDVPQEFDKARGQEVINLARQIQPSIIINNRTGAPGDYDTPEQKIGGFNMNRPWETCMTICHQWAWKPDDKMKSLEECIRTLVLTAGGDGNLLFNVGPDSTGEIEPRQVARLKEMGDWLAQNGESIYATRGGPYMPTSKYAATRKANIVYLHIFQWDPEGIALPPFPAKIAHAELLTGGAAVVDSLPDGLKIQVDPAKRHPIDTVIKITLQEESISLKPIAPLTSGTAATK